MILGHPVSFSDEQFAAIIDAAKLLPRRMRSQFLTNVMGRLAYGHDPQSSVGNVAVSQAINLALRDLQVAG